MIKFGYFLSLMALAGAAVMVGVFKSSDEDTALIASGGLAVLAVILFFFTTWRKVVRRAKAKAWAAKLAEEDERQARQPKRPYESQVKFR